jgi:hypothetical protein
VSTRTGSLGAVLLLGGAVLAVSQLAVWPVNEGAPATAPTKNRRDVDTDERTRAFRLVAGRGGIGELSLHWIIGGAKGGTILHTSDPNFSRDFHAKVGTEVVFKAVPLDPIPGGHWCRIEYPPGNQSDRPGIRDEKYGTAAAVCVARID